MQIRSGLFTLAAMSALLMACGDKKSAEAVVAAPVVVAAAPAAENTVGKSVFGKTCAMCHAIGAAGAPKPGDKADWGPRIAQGDAILLKHALEGFTGAKGVMPARGASPALTDDEVKAAVAYMVDQSR
jgi:cytochrome c5